MRELLQDQEVRRAEGEGKRMIGWLKKIYNELWLIRECMEEFMVLYRDDCHRIGRHGN